MFFYICDCKSENLLIFSKSYKFSRMIHFLFLLICLTLSNEKDLDLPYDDPSDQPTPTANPTSTEDIIDDPDSTTPLFIVLGIIGFLFIVSIISYELGKFEVSNGMTYFQQTLNNFIEKYLYGEKINFMQYGIHEFEVYFKSKNANIYGCNVHVNMCFRCDFIHRFKYLFAKKVDKITFEFLIHPSKMFSAMIHISKESPFFAKDFNLIKKEIACGYSSFSDVPNYDKNLISTISDFIEKHPKLINIIEMSDANRFKFKDKCGFVTRVEFDVTNFQEDITYPTLRFCYDLAESFAKIKMPEQATQENKKKREKLVQRAKIQLEKIRKFQEAQQKFRETGIFPDLEKINNPDNQNEDEKTNTDDNENKENQKDSPAVEPGNNHLDSSGNLHEKTD